MAETSIESAPFEQRDDDHVATLYELTPDTVNRKVFFVYKTSEFILGRDSEKCHGVLSTKSVSRKHVRIHTVVFEDDDEPNKSQRPVPPQVFLVVLSENCIMWNNIRIGKEHKPILLTDGDTIGISPTDNFIFRSKAVKKFPFSDAQARDTLFFQNEYEIAERVLGVGGFGRVHLAVNKVTGEQLACKVISISHLTREVVKLQGMERPELGDPAEDLRLRRGGRKHIEKIMRQMKTHDKEHEILAKLDHPNIIGLDQVMKTNTAIYIFQELVAGGDLHSYLDRKGGALPAIEAAVIVRQLVIALAYLHKNGIAHRDIKPENVLLCSPDVGTRVVLIDFGIASPFDQADPRMLTGAGTEAYIAPELRGIGPGCTKGSYTQSIDMWSLGILAGLLLTTNFPFAHPYTGRTSLQRIAELNLYNDGTEPSWVQLDGRAKDFVQRLLVLDPEERMTAEEGLEHAWFSNPAHRQEFEDVYGKAVAGWRPRGQNKAVFKDFSTVDFGWFLEQLKG